MNRREFIKLSSLFLTPFFIRGDQLLQEKDKYDIYIQSDMEAGHLLLTAKNFPIRNKIKREFLIVGGGIAGLSAAYQIRTKDFVLCEVSPSLGGSSGGLKFEGETYSQGAHYDLAYPEYYGSEVLAFFEEIGVVTFNSLNRTWDFVDKHYLIPKSLKGFCFVDGVYYEDILPDGKLKNAFLKLMQAYSGTMKLPTRLIAENLHKLNNITFTEYLKKSLTLEPKFIAAMDYQMVDDYGAFTDQISAIAGIHYYQCRPYYENKKLELFSPPAGNCYFVDKIAEKLPSEAILLGALVKKIDKQDNGFRVEVVNIKHQAIDIYYVDKVIYAGQKHALKYIYPQDSRLFIDNQYAPWVVVTIVLRPNSLDPGAWQNDFIESQKTFLGFVDSDAQYTNNKTRVLTAYYCFPRDYRRKLAYINTIAGNIVNQTIDKVNIYLEEDIGPFVDKVFLKVMGHAMPIPFPGYLFNDRNKRRSHKDIVYAGVDNGRLPLLFEAVDSGIMAVRSWE